MFDKHIKVDELTHKYYIDLPSVSKVISMLDEYKNDYKDCSIEFLKPYQDRGKCFHYRVEFYIKNNFDFGCICEIKLLEHNLFFDNFLNWYQAYKQNIKSFKTELSLINNYFTGTFDFMYLDSKNQYHLLDWKTNKITHQTKTLLQLMLYEILIKDNFKKLKDKTFIYECYNPNENRFITFNNKQITQAKIQILKIKELLNYDDRYSN